jgi:hypothetical protein
MQQSPICTSQMPSINAYQPLLSTIMGGPEFLTAQSQQCTTSNLSLLNETKCTCHKPGCGHTITYNKPLEQEIILFTPGYHGTNLSGKIVRKGSSSAGSGWLVSKAIKSGVPTDDHLPSCKYILIN